MLRMPGLVTSTPLASLTWGSIMGSGDATSLWGSNDMSSYRHLSATWEERCLCRASWLMHAGASALSRLTSCLQQHWWYLAVRV